MLATTDNYHMQTKHIDTRFHFIRHSVESGVFKLIYCPTDDMVMDILTKALPGWKVKGHTAALRLRSACRGVQDCDPDMQGSTVSPTGLDQAVGPEGASCIAADAPTLTHSHTVGSIPQDPLICFPCYFFPLCSTIFYFTILTSTDVPCTISMCHTHYLAVHHMANQISISNL